MACSLWALRTSGFWFLLAMISASEAPVIALWNFTARRVRFFVTSSCLIKRLLVSQSRNPFELHIWENLNQIGFLCRSMSERLEAGQRWGVDKDIKDQYYDLLLFCGCKCDVSDAAQSAKRSPATTHNTDWHRAHQSPTATPICIQIKV